MTPQEIGKQTIDVLTTFLTSPDEQSSANVQYAQRLLVSLRQADALESIAASLAVLATVRTTTRYSGQVVIAPQPIVYDK